MSVKSRVARTKAGYTITSECLNVSATMKSVWFQSLKASAGLNNSKCVHGIIVATIWRMFHMTTMASPLALPVVAMATVK